MNWRQKDCSARNTVPKKPLAWTSTSLYLPARVWPSRPCSREGATVVPARGTRSHLYYTAGAAGGRSPLVDNDPPSGDNRSDRHHVQEIDHAQVPAAERFSGLRPVP